MISIGNAGSRPHAAGAGRHLASPRPSGELILATLDHYEGDKQRAAEVLGISLKTLYNRLNAYKSEASASG